MTNIKIAKMKAKGFATNRKHRKDREKKEEQEYVH